eukprot:CAMPEP_0182474438 /NCGR_PEP_ID=MMETSP1319-20130603/25648_1 /TAXON_ID=172717 /ORGANISM="Bolidomonas pacifica, Strain RCC208" /LENGTH=127 /DNA_ID=CAMNT_0024675327 /DNA_START=113 /DNA_END=493 /DNA_ORIENTATION=-
MWSTINALAEQAKEQAAAFNLDALQQASEDDDHHNDLSAKRCEQESKQRTPSSSAPPSTDKSGTIDMTSVPSFDDDGDDDDGFGDLKEGGEAKGMGDQDGVVGLGDEEDQHVNCKREGGDGDGDGDG